LQFDRFVVRATARRIVTLKMRGEMLGLEVKDEGDPVLGGEEFVFDAGRDGGERCSIHIHAAVLVSLSESRQSSVIEWARAELVDDKIFGLVRSNDRRYGFLGNAYPARGLVS
jgi:hypothetical protein